MQIDSRSWRWGEINDHGSPSGSADAGPYQPEEEGNEFPAALHFDEFYFGPKLAR